MDFRKKSCTCEDIRPIVRGKAKAPTEFGIKLDVSLDEHGMARIERQSFIFWQFFERENHENDVVGV